MQAEDLEMDPEEREAARTERMGLTPDWIIQACDFCLNEETLKDKWNLSLGAASGCRQLSRIRFDKSALFVACEQAAVFTVFQLPRPTPAQPYIKGLLDPCTNSLAAPNIPAELLYDKKARELAVVPSSSQLARTWTVSASASLPPCCSPPPAASAHAGVIEQLLAHLQWSCCVHVHAQANGLLVSNSWAGFHVLLNPDYSSATQWRFVNRAIDEVENDKVCGAADQPACPLGLSHRSVCSCQTACNHSACVHASLVAVTAQPRQRLRSRKC